MKTVSDLDINKEIRKILVRHWIDLGLLSIRTTNSVSYLRGELVRIKGVDESLSTSIVDTMIRDIERIDGLRRLNLEFENWSNATGRWLPLARPEAEKRHAATPEPGGTYEIESDRR